MSARAFQSAEVAAKFREYPQGLRERLLSLRRLIFDVAVTTDGVGELTETLKWGQPSYLTAQTGSGSTVRLDQVEASPGRTALYFHCQTNLVAIFRELYSGELRFEGDRAILLDADEAVRDAALRHCLSLALTYHLRKRRAVVAK
jgi:Domain of unknown function (DU1801)